MTLGQRLRELRKSRGLSLRELASRVTVGFTYLSKIENHKLEEGHGPSEKLIHMLAVELDGDEEELLLLAEKVPEPIRRRVIARRTRSAVLRSCPIESSTEFSQV